MTSSLTDDAMALSLSSALLLLMLWIGADHHDLALSLNYLALFANRLHR